MDKQKITKAILLFISKQAIKWILFIIVIILSSIIWIPKTVYDMGLIISDNIRKYFTDD